MDLTPPGATARVDPAAARSRHEPIGWIRQPLAATADRAPALAAYRRDFAARSGQLRQRLTSVCDAVLEAGKRPYA